MAIVYARCSQSLLLNVRRRLSSSPSSSSASWSDGHAFDPAIRRLAKSRRFDDIESLLEARKTDLPPRPPPARRTSPPSLPPMRLPACLITPSARWTSSPPRLPSYCYLTNALVSACNHSKALFRRVPDLLSELSRRHSLSPDKISYGILIKSLCLARDASKALPVLREMEEKKIEITKVSYTTILDSLYKEGKPEEAERIWRRCAQGCRPDVVAYNVKCMYWSKSGKSEDVLRLMEEMKDAGLDPDTITYNYLMSCYCKYGRFEDAKRVYRELGEKGCEPNSATFKNLLYALCKNDDFDGGLEVFNDSVKHRKLPDLSSVKMLVELLMKASKVKVATRVVIGLSKKFPELFTGSWKDLEKIVGLHIDE
ncbi:hypothetical protein HPP92_012848 [Vanilla planifolia]|uniref:Pentatricopeptide repeat-containing protein n=1 Tax=Vanilla planifolia TaxID=51239 RepID=A0A835QY93_VANPL|nr:hypothetical protein HPP92_012848 [Vanilla planifolia]